MYSGGFYPYPSPEEYWAYWSRYIYVNRYMDPPKPVYGDLLALVKDRDYFVITTNVDHCLHRRRYRRGAQGAGRIGRAQRLRKGALPSEM